MALTQDELDQVYNYVMGKGQSLAGLPDGGSDLSSMYLAPLLKYSPGGKATLVRLAVSVLKGDSAYQVWVNEPGNAGKTLSDFFLSIKGAKGDPFAFADFTAEQLADLALTYEKLTPEQKEEMKLHFGDLTEADILVLQKPATDAAKEVTDKMAQISQDASAVIKAASDAAGNAQEAADNVQDGKTPILESVNAQSGVVPSGSFTQNGVDAEGNPKYILNLTSPKGKDGQPAIFEQGTTTTLNPAEEARVEVVENGVTPEGNPKYLLNFFIPRGPDGPAGTGTGNVLVDGTGLVIGKKYLFVPSLDDSTAGTFVEYVAPEIPEQVQPDWNATEGKGAILHKPGDATADASGLMSADQFQKLEELNPEGYTKYYYLGGTPDDTVSYILIGQAYVDTPIHRSALQGILAGSRGSDRAFNVSDTMIVNLSAAYTNNIGNIIQMSYEGSGIVYRPCLVTYKEKRYIAIEKSRSSNIEMHFFGLFESGSYNLEKPSIISAAEASDIIQIEQSDILLSGKKLSESGGGGSAYLDLSPLFDAEGNPVTVTTDDFLAKVQLAYDNRVGLAYLIQGIVPISIEVVDGYFNITASIHAVTSDNDNNNNGMVIIYRFKLHKTDKSVIVRGSQNLFKNDGDGTKFLSNDGTYKAPSLELNEEVRISITSNQAQPDTVLNGIVFTVKSGMQTKEYTWSGSAIMFKMPMNSLYTVTFPDIEGYKTPVFGDFLATAGSINEINASYNTCVLTINVSSNQGVTSDLTDLPITLSGGLSKVLTYTGSPLIVKIPLGKDTTITPKQLEGYADVPAITKTPTTAVDSVAFAYNTEFLTFYLNTSSGASANGQIATIDGKEYTYNNPIMTKIPFGKSYTISVNDRIGYKTPAPLSLTADRVSRMESMVYTEIKRGVFILDVDKNLIRKTDWNTANNGKAIGVAVLTNNCEFAISNAQIPTVKWANDGMIQVNGCTTTNVTGAAKDDYRGKENTLAIVKVLEQAAPAAFTCNNITIATGEKGYLGSVGEWQELFNNKTEIDACLSIIGYNELLAAHYWTSTQISNADAWRWRPNDAYLSQAGKVSNAYVRVFFKI